MEGYNVINDILVGLFNEILELEECAIITGEFSNMTVNDMHIVNAIGTGEGKNMSSIAKALGITVGSLTTSMNGLVKKCYAVRERSEEDRRLVLVKLTDKGVRAYNQHSAFHDELTKAAIESVNPEEMPVLIKVLSGVSDFFRGFKKKYDKK